jgi:hypothetical protein
MMALGIKRKLEEVLTGVERCPHCAVRTPLLSRVWMSSYEGNPRGDGGKRSKWAAYACSNCGGVVVARGVPNSQIGMPGVPDLDTIFPKVVSAPDEIPVIPRRFLAQAMEVLHAPDAAAVMAGSAVDAMLKHLGYNEGSLYLRIDKAKGDGLLTQGMAEWAHSVRLGSNRPRHADEANPHVSADEAARSVEFARALGDFLFVLTAQIEAATNATKPA